MLIAPKFCYEKWYIIKMVFLRAEINFIRTSIDMDLGFCLKSMSKDVRQRIGVFESSRKVDFYFQFQFLLL